MFPYTSANQVQNALNARGNALHLPTGRHPLAQLMRNLYLHDGFLQRLALSPQQGQFILSGGLFLFKLTLSRAAQARPTQDADFRCTLPPEPQVVRRAIQDIVTVPLVDFCDFDPTSVRTAPIMGTQGGLNVRITAQLGSGVETLALDLAFGPAMPPQLRHLPTVLGVPATIPVWTEAIGAVMAGKVAALLRHGAGNTRYKDYYDLWSLAHTQDFAGSLLNITLVAACQKDGITPDPYATVLASPTFPHDSQQLQQWQDYLTREGLAQRAPSFPQAIATIRDLYGPVVIGTAQGRTWQAAMQQWR